MAKISPYLMFGGNCREAMEFYKQCLGGELFLQTGGEAPGSEDMPEAMKSRVMHSMLTAGDLTFMASDMMNPEDAARQGNTVALCLICKSKEEIETLFAKFSEGGKVEQPLVEAFFGTYGHLDDKFGMRWMFQYSEDNNA